MPPPTPTDSWEYARRFGIVIDAGSSGSRLQIYSWKDATVAREEGGEALWSSLPKVEKGTRKADDWVTKVEPGISSFADTPEGVAAYLAPLIEHARTQIPPSLQLQTPVFLLATAGMRLLTTEQQVEILQAACDVLKFHSNFRIDDPSSAGPCGSSVRIITGEEEGLFGWLAVNYLMDGFTRHSEDRTTYGFLDMGGASTQIAFEPTPAERDTHQNNLIDVRLRLLGGEEVHHQVFVTTWLGYGTNQARERYVAQTIDAYEAGKEEASGLTIETELVPDPCLPKNLTLFEKPVHTGAASPHNRLAHTLVGTGSFEQCLTNAAPLLNKGAPCLDEPCLFNGVHVPPIDFSVSHFIGVSEYWYSAEHVFGLGGAYDFVQYERAASQFCGHEWDDILKHHADSQAKGQLGGDGELEEGGKIVATGYWGEKVEVSRLQMQCFKAAWIVNILHNGLGMPRIVDPGGNSTQSEGAIVSQKAESKGLGRPTFQSVDTVGDIAISWTLGKMVLEASKEVPPLTSTTKPITDPMEGFQHWIDYPFSFKPPFWDIEDTISDHLPPALTRESLGFSLVGFTFYFIITCALLSMYWRVRHTLRSSIRRFSRNVLCCKNGGRSSTAEGYAMEEGQALNAGAYPTSPHLSAYFPSPKMIKPFKRMASSFRAVRVTPIVTSLSRTHSKSGNTSARASPIRSNSLPIPASTSSSGNMATSSSTNLTSGGSSSAQITPSSPHLNQYDDNMPSFFSTRSRNSSQMNLSSLVPRQAMSRTNSALHLPLDGDE